LHKTLAQRGLPHELEMNHIQQVLTRLIDNKAVGIIEQLMEVFWYEWIQGLLPQGVKLCGVRSELTARLIDRGGTEKVCEELAEVFWYECVKAQLPEKICLQAVQSEVGNILVRGGYSQEDAEQSAETFWYRLIKGNLPNEIIQLIYEYYLQDIQFRFIEILMAHSYSEERAWQLVDVFWSKSPAILAYLFCKPESKASTLISTRSPSCS
jgi:hypothetical protein